MKTLLILLVPLGALLCGCSYNFKFDPVAATGQKEIFDKGIGILISSKTYVVIVAPDPSVYNQSDNPTISIYVKNTSQKEFNLSTSNIRAFAGGNELKVYTYEEIFKKIHKKAALAAWATLWNSAIQQSRATQAQTNSSFSMTGRDSGGNVTTAQGSVKTVNHGEIAREQREIEKETSASLSAIDAQKQNSIVTINDSFLRKTTIMPGDINGGYIILPKIPRLGASETATSENLEVSTSGEVDNSEYVKCKKQRFAFSGNDGSCDLYLKAPTVNEYESGTQDWINVKIVVTIEGEKHEFTFTHSKI